MSESVGMPQSVALDASGNVYFGSDNCVFKVDNRGVLTRVAGVSPVAGYSGDGGPATSARLNGPTGIAVDSAGDVYIADSGNYRVRKVAAGTGIITTVAGKGTCCYSGDGGPAASAGLNGPRSVAVDGSGNLYIADFEDARLRKVAAATGIITTVAGNGTFGYSGDGGPATSAQLYGPAGIAVDSADNLYIADTDNDRIRKVAVGTGIITTVAGSGMSGAYSGDGGPATNAQLSFPEGVAVDGSGNLFIADFINDRIRKVVASTHHDGGRSRNARRLLGRRRTGH